MTFIAEVASKYYSPDIQMSPAQIQAVVGAVLTRGAGCNFLVFGCGRDSPLWAAINRTGFTLFMETDPKWAAEVAAPDLNIEMYAPTGTVSEALRSIALS